MKMKRSVKKRFAGVAVIIMIVMMACVLSSCAGQTPQALPGSNGTGNAQSGPQTAEKDKNTYIDYLVLVNKENPLPEDWESKVQTVHMTNSVGDDVEVEKTAYAAYLRLKKALASENIYVDLDSARRTVAAQQKIVTDFTKKYGKAYVKKYVAVPGYSEHHTGLALDLYLNINGKDIVMNEDLVKHPKIWKKIHERMSDYGFILRYMEGKADITGYSYEPWHLRYVGVDDAVRITRKGITLEEYLGKVPASAAKIDYGTSEIYSQQDMDEAILTIKKEFETWEGCELHDIRYAGDGCLTQENLNWMNSLKYDQHYTQCIEFQSDFHSPVEGGGAWEADREYKDYQWWLARANNGEWELLTWGY